VIERSIGDMKEMRREEMMGRSGGWMMGEWLLKGKVDDGKEMERAVDEEEEDDR
jgi:hypothetical protein